MASEDFGLESPGVCLRDFGLEWPGGIWAWSDPGGFWPGVASEDLCLEWPGMTLGDFGLD